MEEKDRDGAVNILHIVQLAESLQLADSNRFHDF